MLSANLFIQGLPLPAQVPLFFCLAFKVHSVHGENGRFRRGQRPLQPLQHHQPLSEKINIEVEWLCHDQARLSI